MQVRYTSYIVSVIVLFFAAVVPIAHAQQYALPNTENAVFISATPEHPTPGSAVRLKARSSLVDLANSTITWYVDGRPVASGTGLVEANITTGKLGASTNVSLKADSDITTATAQISITPTNVDLLWESDAYVPPFYQGRARPSAGSQLHIQAIPWLKRSSGALIATKDLIFTWKRDGTVLGSLSGRGKSSITVAAPNLHDTDTFTVLVETVDGSLSGTASAPISSLEPQLTLYEDHPLFGILYNSALRSGDGIPENEMSFVAMPYFVAAPDLNSPDLNYEWKINDRPVEADAAKPSRITINAANSTGAANIGLTLTHATNFFLNSIASWRITLSASGSGRGSASPANDAFHSNQ